MTPPTKIVHLPRFYDERGSMPCVNKVNQRLEAFNSVSSAIRLRRFRSVRAAVHSPDGRVGWRSINGLFITTTRLSHREIVSS